MLNILIVDDEPFFLEFMQGFFRSQTLNCEIVGAVSDGLKALEILKSRKVDVIFTDIKMPVMDGLELICSAMELDPEYQFVVLSAYSDFHMVGQAFKLGAKEYALKSEMTEEQIVDILQKCEERKNRLLLEKQKNLAQKKRFAEMANQLSSLQNMVDSSRSELKKKFFRDIISKNITFPEAYQQEYAQFFLPDSLPTAILLVKMDDYHRILQDNWKNNYLLFEVALDNVLEEICEDFQNTVFVCYKPDEYLFFTSSEGGRFELKCKVYDLYSAVKKTLQNSLLMETIISVSGLNEEQNQTASQMYEQANELNSHFFLLGKDTLLSQSLATAKEGEIDPEHFGRLVAEFRDRLTAWDMKGLQENMSAYQIQPSSVNFSQIQQVRGIFQRYVFYLREYAAENNTLKRLQEDLTYFEKYLKEYGTLEEMNEWLEKTVTSLLQQEYHSSSLVKRVKKYVLANYYRELSLTEIAESMGVNPNYLSRAFSKEYGDNLVSYINYVRVQAATNLLKDTNLKNYEIAEKVGYQNVEHFSRIFKKMMGKTPGEYRNNV